MLAARSQLLQIGPTQQGMASGSFCEAHTSPKCQAHLKGGASTSILLAGWLSGVPTWVMVPDLTQIPEMVPASSTQNYTVAPGLTGAHGGFTEHHQDLSRVQDGLTNTTPEPTKPHRRSPGLLRTSLCCFPVFTTPPPQHQALPFHTTPTPSSTCTLLLPSLSCGFQAPRTFSHSLPVQILVASPASS